MVVGYDFDEDDEMDEIESDYQANCVSDNLRTCGRVDSVSSDIHIINELWSGYSYPYRLWQISLKQELILGHFILGELFIIFHKSQTI